eukprot:PLAT1248.1.p1 GENE.PLAT1248.1~~PLAT1248.1.p1  ORF type:complete len:237 (+),score=108.94 PLAT1248.1:112-822(+)
MEGIRESAESALQRINCGTSASDRFLNRFEEAQCCCVCFNMTFGATLLVMMMLVASAGQAFWLLLLDEQMLSAARQLGGGEDEADLIMQVQEGLLPGWFLALFALISLALCISWLIGDFHYHKASYMKPLLLWTIVATVVSGFVSVLIFLRFLFTLPAEKSIVLLMSLLVRFLFETYFIFILWSRVVSVQQRGYASVAGDEGAPVAASSSAPVGSGSGDGDDDGDEKAPLTGGRSA